MSYFTPKFTTCGYYNGNCNSYNNFLVPIFGIIVRISRTKHNYIRYTSFLFLFLSIVICLAWYTKQGANISQAALWMYLPYFFNCLVPAFFRILMYKSVSATSIKVWSASAFSFDFFSSVLSSSIFFINAVFCWLLFVIYDKSTESFLIILAVDYFIINRRRVFLLMPYFKQADRLDKP
jgi:hypothetical protein